VGKIQVQITSVACPRNQSKNPRKPRVSELIDWQTFKQEKGLI